MKPTLRLFLTLFTILCGTTISDAAVQDTHKGVVFEKACVLEEKTGFSANFNAPGTGGRPRVNKLFSLGISAEEAKRGETLRITAAVESFNAKQSGDWSAVIARAKQMAELEKSSPGAAAMNYGEVIAGADPEYNAKLNSWSDTTAAFSPADVVNPNRIQVQGGGNAAKGGTLGQSARNVHEQNAEMIAEVSGGSKGTKPVGQPSVPGKGPDFVVTPNGTAHRVPSGATGPNSTRAPGMQFQGGSGGNRLDPKVTGVRVMDQTNYHSARVIYMNKSGQTVSPITGKTIPRDHPEAHIPLDP